MGMAATKHFCGNKLINIQVFDTEKETDCCGDIPMDCCEDEQFTVAPLQLEIPLPSSPSVNPFSKIIQKLHLTGEQIVSNIIISQHPISNNKSFWQSSPDMQSLLACYLI